MCNSVRVHSFWHRRWCSEASGSYDVNFLPVLIKFEHIVQIFVRNERLFCFPQINNVLTLLCKILGDIVQNDEHLTLCETRKTLQPFITKVRCQLHYSVC